MAAIFGIVMDQYNYLMSLKDPRVEHFPLMTSPMPIICLSIFYVYFTTNLGPKLMKDRPAIDCKNAMILYNFVQIFLNGIFVVEACRLIWFPMKYSLLCAEVDYSNDPLAVKITRYAWLFFITKVLDMLDTVFMVLRKKNSQISFLHVYHHTGMVLGGWVGTRFVPGGYVVFFGTVNSFVHVVMYSYYLVTALYPQYKNNIWWKRHITEIQLVQFVICAVHGAVNFLNPHCNFPKPLIGIFIPQDAFMFMMFWDFYQKTYLTPNKDGKKQS